MDELAVELVEVSKIFRADTAADRDVEALQKVSLDIKENEFFTLLGPSGCG